MLRKSIDRTEFKRSISRPYNTRSPSSATLGAVRGDPEFSRTGSPDLIVSRAPDDPFIVEKVGQEHNGTRRPGFSLSKVVEMAKKVIVAEGEEDSRTVCLATRKAILAAQRAKAVQALQAAAEHSTARSTTPKMRELRDLIQTRLKEIDTSRFTIQFNDCLEKNDDPKAGKSSSKPINETIRTNGQASNDSKPRAAVQRTAPRVPKRAEPRKIEVYREDTNLYAFESTLDEIKESVQRKAHLDGHFRDVTNLPVKSLSKPFKNLHSPAKEATRSQNESIDGIYVAEKESPDVTFQALNRGTSLSHLTKRVYPSPITPAKSSTSISSNSSLSFACRSARLIEAHARRKAREIALIQRATKMLSDDDFKAIEQEWENENPEIAAELQREVVETLALFHDLAEEDEMHGGGTAVTPGKSSSQSSMKQNKQGRSTNKQPRSSSSKRDIGPLLDLAILSLTGIVHLLHAKGYAPDFIAYHLWVRGFRMADKDRSMMGSWVYDYLAHIDGLEFAKMENLAQGLEMAEKGLRNEE